jgi:thiol-disulfide isomerase/thioredoxin
MRRLWALSATAILLSCSGDGTSDLDYAAIEITTEVQALVLGKSAPVSVTGITEDGTKSVIANAAIWSLSPEIVEVQVDAQGAATILTHKVGTAMLQAAFGPNFELTAEVMFEVLAPQLESIDLRGTTTGTAAPRLSLGTQMQLIALGSYTDGSSGQLSTGLQFASSDEAVATTSPTGLISSIAVGVTTVSVTFAGLSASVEVEVFCSYQSSTDALTVGQLSPNMRWVGAHLENDVMVDFSMEEFYCSTKFARYTTVNFVIGTGWCPFCPQFMQYVNSISSELDAAGGLIVYVEAQNDAREPATNLEANEIVTRYIQDGPGYRVGDGDTMPSSLVFQRSVEAYPSAIVVRRRDLKTIAYQRGGGTGFDFVGMAQDPELTGFVNNCDDNDEEASEPNDAPGQAAALSIGDNSQAGICNDAPDFYQITHEGRWKLTIEFDHNLGDLDAFAWDTMENKPLEDASGNRIGSATSNSNESFSHSGPAIVRVSGFRSSSAPYRIRLQTN